MRQLRWWWKELWMALTTGIPVPVPLRSAGGHESHYPWAKDQERRSAFRPQFPHLSNGAVRVLGCRVCISTIVCTFVLLGPRIISWACYCAQIFWKEVTAEMGRAGFWPGLRFRGCV